PRNLPPHEGARRLPHQPMNRSCMSPEQESTAVRVSAPTGRWREYTQLSRQIKQAGLLERRRGWYGARIGLNLALLAGGRGGLAMPGGALGQVGGGRYVS